MTIPFTKGRIYQNLAFGIGWIAIATALAVLDWDDLGVDNYLWFVIAFLYLGQFYNDRYLHYLEITESHIRRNSFPRKTMKLDDIVRVQNDWDEYVLFTRNSRMKIRLVTADRKSIPQLESFLEGLSARTRKSIWAETPEQVIS